jgi:hypothetical protein
MAETSLTESNILVQQRVKSSQVKWKRRNPPTLGDAKTSKLVLNSMQNLNKNYNRAANFNLKIST